MRLGKNVKRIGRACVRHRRAATALEAVPIGLQSNESPRSAGRRGMWENLSAIRVVPETAIFSSFLQKSARKFGKAKNNLYFCTR